MADENADWGALKIHGELLKLGFDASQRTVARYLRRIRRRGDPATNWLAFLENRLEVIVAFDFSTVSDPTTPRLTRQELIEQIAVVSEVSRKTDRDRSVTLLDSQGEGTTPDGYCAP
jgi:hypothetical protein